MIATVLIPQLQARFPDRALRISDDSPPIATFPAINSEVGDIEIHDDGDEVTLYLVNFSHGHFGNYEDHLPLAVRQQKIVDAVVDTLDRIFTEKIEFSTGRWSGGWGPRGSCRGDVFVWSGRVSVPPE